DGDESTHPGHRAGPCATAAQAPAAVPAASHGRGPRSGGHGRLPGHVDAPERGHAEAVGAGVTAWNPPVRLAGGVAAGRYGLARAFNTHVVSLTLHGVISSGLARPDFYPWPQKLRQDIDRLHPQIVVVMIGGNDFHSVLLPNGLNIAFAPGKTWREAYSFR